MELNQVCHFCGNEITGEYIALDYQEVAHEVCYALEHPFEPYKTFPDLLNQMNSSSFLRDLLVEYVPNLIQDHILAEYNKVGLDRQKKLQNNVKEPPRIRYEKPGPD